MLGVSLRLSHRLDVPSRAAARLLAVAALSLAAAPLAWAGQTVFVAAQQSQTIDLAGGAAAFAPPSSPTNYYTAIDPFTGEVSISIPVFFDTGASGNVMSQTNSSALGIPLSGEHYQDQGIGGLETFNVSQPTVLGIAPSSTIVNGTSDDPASMTNYGTFKFQVRQSDPADPFLGEPLPIDIVGTPVLRNTVLHVQPNTVDVDIFQTFTSQIMHSELLTSMPSNLPSKGVFRIPVKWTNYLTPAQQSGPVTVGENPAIEGVQIIDGRKPANQQSAPQPWLLDTGGSVTIIGRDYATSVGINLDTETPVNEVTVFGIGDSQRVLNGYHIDELKIPMANGDDLIYTNMIVYVPADADSLPGDIGGILGVNNFAPAFETIDEGTGLPADELPSRYSDWYFDGPNSQLVLVDPNSNFVGSVPEPAAGLLLVGGASLWLRRRRRAVATAA